MINHPGQWLYEEGQAHWAGLDFNKEDAERGQWSWHWQRYDQGS